MKDEFTIKKDYNHWRVYRKGNWRASINFNETWQVGLWVYGPDGNAAWRHHALPDGTTKRTAFAACRNFLRLGMDTGP